MIDKISDRNGNYISYHYTKKDYLTPYLTCILYGNEHTQDFTEVTFKYSEKKIGEHASCMVGEIVHNKYYCTEITVRRQFIELYSYALSYDIDSNTGTPFLTSVQKFYPGGNYIPATTVAWANRNVALEQVGINTIGSFKDPTIVPCDINGDGLDDLMVIYKEEGDKNLWLQRYANTLDQSSNKNQLSVLGNTVSLGVDATFGYQARFHNSGMQAADVDGDGIAELITSAFKVIGSIANFELQIHHTTESQKLTYRLEHSSSVPAYTCADFNNDGYDEIIFIEDKKILRICLNDRTK